MKKEKGFTLIELLVVIAIIAILSTVVMAGLNSARLKGRDAKRLSDIKQLQSALELCFDNGVGYPGLAANSTMADLGAANCAAGGTPFSTYMSPMPANPAPGGIAYTYCSEVSGAANGTCDNTSHASYQIKFNLEGQSGSLAAGDHYARPSGIQ
jgi:prepilin-type N-terminal cleavage/methylation domain-containing protein